MDGRLGDSKRSHPPAGLTASYGHFPALQVPALHSAPAQHAWPLPPHAAQLPATHTSPPLHHSPPALFPGQHGSPVPPQPTHTFALHAENAAVHPTPPPQQASPTPPQPPPRHAPLKHLPCPPPHVAVFATHVFTVWSQHPPPPHETPSQQG